MVTNGDKSLEWSTPPCPPSCLARAPLFFYVMLNIMEVGDLRHVCGGVGQVRSASSKTKSMCAFAFSDVIEGLLEVEEDQS